MLSEYNAVDITKDVVAIGICRNMRVMPWFFRGGL